MEEREICLHVMSLNTSFSMKTTRITPVVHTLPQKLVKDQSPAQPLLTSRQEQRSLIDPAFSANSYKGPTAKEWV